MQTVFDTAPFRAQKRLSAWQDAICEHYAIVNVQQLSDEFYCGQIREGLLGTLKYTMASGTPNMVSREPKHLSVCQNDNIFVQLVQSGKCDVEQRGQYFTDTRGRAIVFTVAEPYTLRYQQSHRSVYVEIPREELKKRTKIENLKCLGSLDLGEGTGRLFHDYCMAIYRNYESMSPAERELVGCHLIDLFVMAASRKAPEERLEVDIKEARRSAVKLYIENNFNRPALSAATIAKENGISLRYLHNLFEDTGESVSEVFWDMRVQHSRELLRSPAHVGQNITEIAYACGFNSSSHFCNLFKLKFGETPTEFRVRAAREELSN
ncbi:helix-turn-helix domain-containing protein [Rhizobium sp. NZLR11]|uniref:helix-turn-helix domain-containing protein n=1 Tax=Rhizobium sp. NZLR11 TaxID=2731098 RepID=UPI001C837491|nr:helix-turn-helix domain-containing protein [Rhizobium sp. NZLR11]MBX5210467.1 helix-turn-helix domain-containing protein [Rhizobium sp. NZLR11]